jgi:excisionase family DNA binding protein
MEALDKPYWTTKTPTLICDGMDLTPVSAEEVVIGGLRQIMEAVKKLQPKETAPAPAPPEPKPPQSYDLAGAAEYLGMTPRKLRELFKARRVAGSRIDYRHYLFTRADLNEFLAAYRSKPKRI